MKTDESPSEAEKEEHKAEASTNTNGKQRERRAFWEKVNRDVYRTEHLSFLFSRSVLHQVSLFLSIWSPMKMDPGFVQAKKGLFLEPKLSKVWNRARKNMIETQGIKGRKPKSAPDLLSTFHSIYLRQFHTIYFRQFGFLSQANHPIRLPIPNLRVSSVTHT